MCARTSLTLIFALSVLVACAEPVPECSKPYLTTYPDADDDGFGDAAAPETTCGVPKGRSENGQDCDDSTPDSHVEAIEICDNLDNDCNGLVDDGLEGLIWYEDVDGDGYGDLESTADTCLAPEGFVDNADDCDDADDTFHPDAEEICDRFDNNCNGLVDGRDGDLDCGEWVEDFELGAMDSYWTFSGPGWDISNDAYEGSFSALSQNINNNGSTGMQVEVFFSADGNLGFWYSGDSESNYDFLRFSIDGVQRDAWSGSISWTRATYQVGAGLHTLTWEYTKDGSQSTGADGFQVDLIESTNSAI